MTGEVIAPISNVASNSRIHAAAIRHTAHLRRAGEAGKLYSPESPPVAATTETGGCGPGFGVPLMRLAANAAPWSIMLTSST